MDFGKLISRIHIWQAAANPARDGYGGVTDTPELVCKVWAEIMAVSAREVELARGYAPTVSHKVRIRHRAGLNARMWITLGERTLAINGVTDPDDSHRELILYCTEVTS
jgi:SPP1 family predicted phage head-tail adaptor